MFTDLNCKIMKIIIPIVICIFFFGCQSKTKATDLEKKKYCQPYQMGYKNS